MKKRIFLAVMLVALAVMISGMAIVMAASYDYFGKQTLASLEASVSYLSEGYKRDGIDYLKAVYEDTERITLIDAQGNVLFDNASESEMMENHANRKEVQDALEYGSGYDTRNSETLAERRIYYAERLENGEILRTSARQKTAIMLLGEMLGQMVLLMVFVLAAAIVLARLISKWLTSPINEIDPEHPEKTEVYAELQPLIGKLQHQNEIIAEQMEQLMRENLERENLRREFTANVSHELKTPLTTISGTAEILKSGMVKEQDVPHFAENIYHEAQRMISLVTDIIKISQLDENRVPMERETVDLYALSQDIIEWLHDEADKKSVSLSVTGVHARTDGVVKILDEMIYNLCDNAIKYNHPGGNVTIEISERDGKAAVSVCDDGIGIPEEHQARIFERFYRVDKSHSREIGGTGLGLSIVKHGAMFHNAALELQSEAGKGTRISIIFDAV